MIKEQRLQYVEKLGKGTHGSVYLLRNFDKTPELLVCKSISAKNKKYGEKELKILKKIRHQRIISFYSSIEKKNCRYIYMEYANYGDLEKLLCFLRRKNCKIQRKIAWSVLSQIIDALEYLQRHNIIHRDIKPGNILLNRAIGDQKNNVLIKIADFSLSAITDNQEGVVEDKIVVGTPYYMAPEIIKRKKYDSTVDIWSTGVLMYEMISHNRPFEAELKSDLRKMILKKEIVFVPNCMDDYLQEIILRCLLKENRPSASQIIENKFIKLHLNKCNRETSNIVSLNMISKKFTQSY